MICACAWEACYCTTYIDLARERNSFDWCGGLRRSKKVRYSQILVVRSIVEGPVSSFVLFHPKERLKKEEENTAGGVRKRQEKPLTLTAERQGVNISNAHYTFNNSPKAPRVAAKTTICNCRKLPTSDLLSSR